MGSSPDNPHYQACGGDPSKMYAPDNNSPVYSTDHQWDVAPHEAYLASQQPRDCEISARNRPATVAASAFASGLGASLNVEDPACAERLESEAGSAHRRAVDFATPLEEPAVRPCRHLMSTCKNLHRDAAGKPVKFGTMSFKCRLNHAKVDMKILASNIPGGNVFYCAAGFTSLLGGARDQSKRATFLIRLSRGSSRTATLILCPNGSIQVFGTSSYAQCVQALRKFLHRLRRTASQSGRPAVHYPKQVDIEGNLSVELVKRDFDLGVGIVLERVIGVLRGVFDMDYNNEMYAGLKVKATKRATVIIFHTGRVFVTVTGSGDKASAEISAEIEEAYKNVCGRIWARIKDVANMTSIRKEPRSKSSSSSSKQAMVSTVPTSDDED
jgi:TATA-box binding protein (TBP) (component of TFIID and TFIIIB)